MCPVKHGTLVISQRTAEASYCLGLNKTDARFIIVKNFVLESLEMGYLFVFFFILVVSIIVISHRRLHVRWKSTPTMVEYLKDNPECKIKSGLKCAPCGSTSIRNWGVNGAQDPRRVFICNHCGTHLYRNT